MIYKSENIYEVLRQQRQQRRTNMAGYPDDKMEREDNPDYRAGSDYRVGLNQGRGASCQNISTGGLWSPKDI